MPADPECPLRSRARDLIREGRLPAMRPRMLCGGPGSGRECTLCGEVIAYNDLGPATGVQTVGW